MVVSSWLYLSAIKTEVKAQGHFKLSTFCCLSARHKSVTWTCLSSFELYTSFSQPWRKHHIGGTCLCAAVFFSELSSSHHSCWWFEASLQVPVHERFDGAKGTFGHASPGCEQANVLRHSWCRPLCSRICSTCLVPNLLLSCAKFLFTPVYWNWEGSK